jgi:hypothetical protein
MTVRYTLRLRDDAMNWLQNNYRANGHQTISKFVDSILSDYIKSKTPSMETTADGPINPRQEVDKIVEEIGKLTEQYGEKFEAMRSMVPKDAPKLQTMEDVRKRVDYIWMKVIDKNGFVRGDRNKVVPLSRTDLKSYEQLCQLQLRKLELMKVMTAGAATQ